MDSMHVHYSLQSEKYLRIPLYMIANSMAVLSISCHVIYAHTILGVPCIYHLCNRTGIFFFCHTLLAEWHFLISMPMSIFFIVELLLVIGATHADGKTRAPQLCVEWASEITCMHKFLSTSAKEDFNYCCIVIQHQRVRGSSRVRCRVRRRQHVVR